MVFIGKSNLNLKCHVAPKKSLVRKRVYSGRQYIELARLCPRDAEKRDIKID